jgi:hypothetical protein
MSALMSSGFLGFNAGAHVGMAPQNPQVARVVQEDADPPYPQEQANSSRKSHTVCVKQKPAVGQPLNLQTLPLCLLLLLLVVVACFDLSCGSPPLAGNQTLNISKWVRSKWVW